MEKEYAEEVKEKLEKVKAQPNRVLTECEITVNHHSGWSTVHVDKKRGNKERVYMFYDEIDEVNNLIDKRRVEEGVTVGFHNSENKLKLIIQ